MSSVIVINTVTNTLFNIRYILVNPIFLQLASARPLLSWHPLRRTSVLAAPTIVPSLKACNLHLGTVCPDFPSPSTRPGQWWVEACDLRESLREWERHLSRAPSGGRSMKSKRRGSGTPRAFSCSTTDVSCTRWISGAVAAGSDQKVSSV